MTYDDYLKTPVVPGAKLLSLREWNAQQTGTPVKPTESTQTVVDRLAGSMSAIGVSRGISLPPAIWTTILQLLLGQAQGCFPIPALAAYRIKRWGPLVQLEARRACEPYATYPEQVDTMEAILREETMHVTPAMVSEAWSALPK